MAEGGSQAVAECHGMMVVGDGGQTLAEGGCPTLAKDDI
jgi:hypothetical protein